MTLEEAIIARHSVRKYTKKPLEPSVIEALQKKIEQVNDEGNLHIQLVLDEPRAFSGLLSYGKFYNVRNYLVIAGPRDKTLEVRAGYYGQLLVLYAQTLGLNTCWVGLSYRKIEGTYSLDGDEKVLCYIALGYGETPGNFHKTKTVGQLGGVTAESPAWYRAGVEAARLAPTAVNQQKFRFELTGQITADGRSIVKADKGHSIFGYTSIDLGIARRNFEIGAGTDNFVWA